MIHEHYVYVLSPVQLCDLRDCSLPGSSVHGIFHEHYDDHKCSFLTISFYRLGRLNLEILDNLPWCVTQFVTEWTLSQS